MTDDYDIAMNGLARSRINYGHDRPQRSLGRFHDLEESRPVTPLPVTTQFGLAMCGHGHPRSGLDWLRVAMACV